MDIDHKVAVVTGASRGLGAAIAVALAEKGATVYGLARNKSALNKIQKQIGTRFLPVEMDISQSQQVRDWVEQTFNSDHYPDILVNNAGIGIYGTIDRMPESIWQEMVNINLNGTYYMTAALVPWMKKNTRTTHIVNIGSILGTVAGPTSFAYSATKFGLQGFNESLFKGLREYSIKVTLVNPGSIETDFFKESGVKSHSNMLHPEDVAATVIHVIETPDNLLIDNLTVRPLHPKAPKS